MSEVRWKYEGSSVHLAIDIELEKMTVRSSVLWRRLEGQQVQGTLIPVGYDSNGVHDKFAWYSEEEPPACPEHVRLNMSKALEHTKLFKVRHMEVSDELRNTL